MAARVFIVFIVVGGITMGAALGHISVRRLVEAFGPSDALLQRAERSHATTRVLGTVRTVSADGYVSLETRDLFGLGETIFIYGHAANPAHVTALGEGAYISAEVRRASGALIFDAVMLIRSRVRS